MKKLISFVSAMMLTVCLFNANVMADVSQANETASEICADEVGYGADGSDANADTKSLENNDTESGDIEPDNPEPVIQPMWNNDGTGHMYYTDASGNRASGWQNIDGSVYYLDANGYATTGWQLINGSWYYMNTNGVMTTGWQLVGGGWYYMNTNGVMTTGWQYVDEQWYYMNAGGAMTTGWQYVNGNWFYMNGSGVMLTGWLNAGSWYYLSAGGAMLTGWQYINGTWYYLDGSGAMVTGWLNDGVWYYLDGSGAMTTGWQYVNGQWYYLNGSGVMLTGWQFVDNCWYYLQTDGRWIDTARMDRYAQGYSSSTNYLILVDRASCVVGVYSGSKGKWSQRYIWSCAPGKASTPTVSGEFNVAAKGYYFDSGNSRCFYFTQFKGNYLFHSVLYHKNGTLQDGRVGIPLSHGCVRLEIANAKWIYDNIPAGTHVVVY